MTIERAAILGEETSFETVLAKFICSANFEKYLVFTEKKTLGWSGFPWNFLQKHTKNSLTVILFCEQHTVHQALF